MSRIGAAIRSEAGICKALGEIKQELDGFDATVQISHPKSLHKVFRLRDILICQYVYLSAMINYMEQGGKSRGSALYSDAAG